MQLVECQWHKHRTCMQRHSHIEAIMLEVARWCSGNQTAASLVGIKRMKGWARAPKVWPNMTNGNRSAWVSPHSVPQMRPTAPTMFSQDPRINCRLKMADRRKISWVLPTVNVARLVRLSLCNLVQHIQQLQLQNMNIMNTVKTSSSSASMCIPV